MAPPPFPEVSAYYIAYYAMLYGQEAALPLIREIRDWLGHPEVVMERAETWDPEVKSTINASDDSLVTARADLEAYWEGPAFDSFKVYVTHLESVIASTSDVTAEFSNLLQKIRETITKTYREAVRFIGECAAIIIEVTGGIIPGTGGIIGGALLLVATVVCDAIAAFIRNVTELVSRNGMSFTAIKALTWGDGALTCKAVIITRH